jgi:hypothetical protein
LRREVSSRVAADEMSHASVRRDAIDDLLRYRDEGTGETRRAFLSDALSRIEAGQHVYTRVEGGQLCACAWVCEATAAESLNEELPEFTVPSDGAVILNFRDFSADGSASEGLLAAILEELGRVDSVRQVFLASKAGSTVLRSAARAAFTAYACVTRTKRFGITHVASSLPAAPAGLPDDAAAAAAHVITDAVVGREVSHNQPNTKRPNQKKSRRHGRAEAGQSEELEAPSAA